MADQGNPSDGQAVEGQVNERISFDDLVKKLNEEKLDEAKLRKEAMDVFIECRDIYESNRSPLNLDVLDEMSKRYNKETRRAAKFEWSDEDLIKMEKVMTRENAVIKGDKIEKVYNDPIHGNIKINRVCQAIIDTPEFQRLRDIKQMGMKSHVYPGAVHTRFEHSLGVCYLAGEFARQLQRNQPFLDITQKDILCVEIAGLCHDLGHGPFSHLFDEVMKELPKHEKRSVALLELLIKRNESKLEESFKQYKLWKDDKTWVDDNDFTFIKEMIVPEDSEAKKGRHKLKHFLYEIVSNKSTEVDVDKFDYLARDCHHLGMKNNFDHRRFMMFARVNFINGVGKICVRDKELPNLFNMYITRYTQQKFVWYHKVTTSVELMMLHVLKKAEQNLKLCWKENEDEEENYGGFCQLTDHITTQILLSTGEGMSEARKILQRILKRDFYKCVYESEPFEMKDGVNKEEASKEIENKIREAIQENCPEFEVKFYSLDLGKKKEKPLDYMPVYKKKDRYTALDPKSGEASKILYPVTCLEYIVRVVYCGDKEDQAKRLEGVASKCVDEKVREIKKENSSGPGPSKRTRLS